MNDALRRLTMAVFAACAVGLVGATPADVRCNGKAVCRMSDTLLPLRALARPDSSLYERADSASTRLNSNMRPFSPFYVFEQKDLDFTDPAKPRGWYHVGYTDKAPEGWMRAADVLEWKQALIMAYTHPGTGDERRHPVLMFDSRPSLDDLVSNGSKGKRRAEGIYDDLERTPRRIADGLITMEPKRFVDIDENFYLMPVVEFDHLADGDIDSRLLRVATAVPRARADVHAPDTLRAGGEYAEQAVAEENLQGVNRDSLGVAVKFVLDVSGSMGPYVAGTKAAIDRMAKSLSSLNTKVSFGLIGYRDDVEELTSRLTGVDGFRSAISRVEAKGGGDAQEEVFAGVKKAIESNWGDHSHRVIIMVGDWSSHAPDHPKSLTGMTAREIASLANRHRVAVVSMHLIGPENREDQPLAEEQYRTLATTPGAQFNSYFPVEWGNADLFERSVRELTRVVAEEIAAQRAGDVSITKREIANPERFELDEAESRARAIGESIMAAQTVEYLGAGTPPKDLTAWLFDRDLLDPRKQAVEVSVLLTRGELNNMVIALESIWDSMVQSKVTGADFLDSVKSLVTTTVKGLGADLGLSESIARSSRILPKWIASLPYRSRLQGMTIDDFEASTRDEREKIEEDLQAKLKLYQALLADDDVWVSLYDGSESIDEVIALSLADMP